MSSRPIDPRYSTSRWRNMRAYIRARDGGVCRIRLEGCTGLASAVDHIASPVEGGEFFDPDNLRAACHYCNSVLGGRLGHARSRTRNRPSRQW